MFRTTIACGRVTVPITCSLITTMLSFSAATAEYGIPARTGSVALYQEAAQDASTGEWVEPVTADPALTDAAAADQGNRTRCGLRSGSTRQTTDAATNTASKEALSQFHRLRRSRDRRMDRP